MYTAIVRAREYDGLNSYPAGVAIMDCRRRSKESTAYL